MAFEYIAGRHAVYHLLLAGRRKVQRLFISSKEDHSELQEILKLASQHSIPLSKKSESELQALSGVERHQGVMIEASPYEYSDAEELAVQASREGQKGFLLILDQVQDPQHVGALARTAYALGAHGLILSEMRAAGVTPAVVRSSVGAVEHLPVAQVSSIAKFLDTLKEYNFWIYGADMTGKFPIDTLDFRGHVALVIGNEGEGLRRLVREKCDFLVSIPMLEHFNSLSAGASGTIFLYEVFRQRRKT